MREKVDLGIRLARVEAAKKTSIPKELTDKFNFVLEDTGTFTVTIKNMSDFEEFKKGNIYINIATGLVLLCTGKGVDGGFGGVVISRGMYKDFKIGHHSRMWCKKVFLKIQN